jgi:palmitoyl transferase
MQFVPSTFAPHALHYSFRTLRILTIAFLFTSAVRAGTYSALVQSFAGKFENIKLAAQYGQWDIYASGHALHLPWSYNTAERARLNSNCWGGGIGRSSWTANGDRHSLYLMSFSDSHRKQQYVAGYFWHRYRRVAHPLFLGWGYSAFLFSREDVANRFPLPGLLPDASIRYRNWELLGLYIPPITRVIKGDVFYVLARVGL